MAQSKKAKVPSKMCQRCGQVMPLFDFYVNKEWRDQNGRDAWCKKCATRYCTTKAKVQEYCWYNNRKWSETHWEKAREKANYVQAVNTEYLSTRTSQKRRSEIEEQITCRQFFCIMNFGGMYAYSENITQDAPVAPFDADSPTGTLTRETASRMLEDAEDPMAYSEQWNGYYTAREVAYLDGYYADLDREFNLSDRSMRDYARKVAKASLEADIIHDKWHRGKATIDELKRAQEIFDKYSQSAAFAACRRPSDQGAPEALPPLGEIIRMIEEEGLLQTTKVEFPPDDVDKIIADFAHTWTAVGEA